MSAPDKQPGASAAGGWQAAYQSSWQARKKLSPAPRAALSAHGGGAGEAGGREGKYLLQPLITEFEIPAPVPFIFRGCQGWFQHLKERRIKKIFAFLPLSAYPLTLLSPSLPSFSAFTPPPVGLRVGEGMPERDVSGCSGHPLGGDGPVRSKGCDGGAWRTSRARGWGGEPGSARAAVLGCAGCHLWGLGMVSAP